MRSKKNLILQFLILLLVSLLAITGCNSMVPVVVNSSTNSDLSENSTPFSTYSPDITETPPSKVIKNFPGENAEKGQVYEFDAFGWNRRYAENFSGEISPLRWRVADETDEFILLVLNEDSKQIAEEFSEEKLHYSNYDLLDWLNETFFYEIFDFYFRENVSRLQYNSIITNIGEKSFRLFLLSDEQWNLYFNDEDINNTALRPAIKIQKNKLTNSEEAWEYILEQFSYRLKHKDISTLIYMLGVDNGDYGHENIKRNEAAPFYDFLIKADIENVKVLSKKMIEYDSKIKFSLEIDVSTSETKWFTQGVNLWDIDIGHSEDGIISYFRPSSNNLDKAWRESDAVTYLGYRYLLHFLKFSFKEDNLINDFNSIIPPDTEESNQEYINFVASMFRFFEFYLYSTKITVTDFEENAEKVLGIKGIDLRKHPQYIADGDYIDIFGMGGSWFYVGVDARYYDAVSKTHTLDLSMYSDSAYLLPCIKVQFKILENPDGSLTIISVEKTFDNGLFPASGSI